MPSLFRRIVNGEIPCHKIAETENYLAFLDIRPLHAGHTLAIPKKEVDYIFDLEDEELSGLMLFAKGVAAALRQCVDCKRIGVAVVGLEVPHTHVHLIPIHQISDMSFEKGPIEMSQEELAQLAEKIRGVYENA